MAFAHQLDQGRATGLVGREHPGSIRRLTVDFEALVFELQRRRVHHVLAVVVLRAHQLRRARRRRVERGPGPRSEPLVHAVTVTGAASNVEARRAAKAIANSLLVKTAIHGGDPNWGRLVAVAGRAGVAFDLARAAVRLGPVVLFADGRPHDEAASDAAAYLKNPEIAVTVDLGAGEASSTVWTCDLSAEYVRINAEYRT